MKKLWAAKVKLAMSKKTVPQKLVQGQTVMDMSKKSPSFSGPQPLLDNLGTQHTALKTAQANLDQASQARAQAKAVRDAALSQYHMAFGNWGNNVDTVGQRPVRCDPEHGPGSSIRRIADASARSPDASACDHGCKSRRHPPDLHPRHRCAHL